MPGNKNEIQKLEHDDIYHVKKSSNFVKVGSDLVRQTGKTVGSDTAASVAIVDGSGNQITSFGGGTQYTEGDTDTTVTGTAVMWEDSSDTLRVASSAKPLPVNIVAGGAGDGALLDGANSAIKATVFDYTNSNPLAVVLRDTNGDYVAVGGGTQYTEDAAAAADPVGTMSMAVRADSLAAVTSTDGDNIALRSTNKGELYVKQTDSVPVTDNGGSLTVDGTVAVSGTVAVTQSGTWDEVGINDSGNSITVDDGGSSLTVDGSVSISGAVDTELTTADLDTGAGTDTRAVVGLVGSASGGGQLIPGSSTDGLLVNLGSNNDVTVTGAVAVTQSGTWDEVGINDSGNSITVDDGGTTLSIDDGASSITVDGTVTANLAAGTNNIGDVDVLSVVPGTSATSLGKAIDSAAGSTDTGVATLAVRVDSPGTLTPVDGDYVPLRVNANGQLWVANNQFTDINSNTANVANTVFVEDEAHSSGDSGLSVLGVRRDADTSPVGADGDYHNLIFDNAGNLKVNVKAGSTAGTQYTEGDTDTTITGTALLWEDASDTLRAVSASKPLPVSLGTSDVDVVPGDTSLWGIYPEDSTHTDTDRGSLIFGVRNDSGSTTFGGNGDYTPLATDANGRVGVSDLGGSISIDDNSSSITVDGTVTANLAAGTNNIGDVDVLSVIPGTGATNLGKAVDSVAGATDTGIAPLAVRDDSLSTLSEAEGDYVPLRVSATGALHVTGGGGGTEYTEDAVAPADPVGATFMMTRDDQLSTVTEAEGDWSRPRGTSKGALWVALADSNGDPITSFGGGTQYTEGDVDTTITGTALMWEDASDTLRAVSTSKPLPVDLQDSTVAVTQSGTWNITDISGTVSLPTGAATAAKQDTQTTAQQAIQTSVELIDDAIKADDAAFTPATTKVMMAGFEYDDTTPDSVDEGDAGAARMSANRNVYTQIRDAAGNERGANVNASNQLSVSVDNTVTVASHAVTNAGTFAVQESGSALTALQLIDDPVATLGTTTYSEATTKGMIIGAVRRDADTTLVDTTNEVSPLQVDANGRLKVEAFSGETLPVSLASVPSHAVTNAGTFAVQVDGAALTALQLIDDGVATTGSAITTKGMAAVGTDGTNARILKTDTSGELQVDVLTMPTTAVSQSGTWTVQPGNTANTTAWLVTDTPATSGGLSKYHVVSAATTNAANVKASAGQVYCITAFNTNSSARYLKFHNTAGTPTAGSGVTDTFLIPGNTAGAGVVINIDKGIAFSTGIGVSITGAIADADTTAIGASDVVLNIYYK